ncbi:MAG: hypothetical protein HYU51_15590 [Candidatus Rokubacteria bacterium]|nr:hypothetical protein [Candidatus Rokubacteria bacterium]
MRVVCAWCRREAKPALIGEREPLDDPQETHGICRAHAGRIANELPSRSFPGVRVLLVVAPSETSLYRYLERSFATVRDVKVIVDRRQGDRRCRRAPVDIERRRGERRLRSGVPSPLGYRIVRFGAGPSVAVAVTER